MYKTIKVMLYPNNKQETRMFEYANAARYAYNWALGREEENYKNGGKFISDGELRKEFTILKKQEGYEWLQKIDCDVTKQAIKEACNAYKRFFKGYSKFPRFKSKKKTIPSFYQDTVKIQFTETHVKLSALTDSKRKNRQRINWVKLAEKGRIPSNKKYVNPRIKYDGIHWWLTVGIECEESKIEPNKEGIGIDLGIKELAICSDKNTYGNINKTGRVRNLEKRKRRLQRAISRKYEKNKKGNSYCKTNNIKKAEKDLLKITHQLSNIRHNYIHQMTTEIIKREPSFICIEDLNVKGMMRNKHISKAIQEQELGEVRRQIEYKSLWNNIPVVIADRWFPSSKICNCCGVIKKDLKLKDRVYKCDCGYEADRDYNASLNLRDYVLLGLA